MSYDYFRCLGVCELKSVDVAIGLDICIASHAVLPCSHVFAISGLTKEKNTEGKSAREHQIDCGAISTMDRFVYENNLRFSVCECLPYIWRWYGFGL